MRRRVFAREYDAEDSGKNTRGTRDITIVLLCTIGVCLLVPFVHAVGAAVHVHPPCTSVVVPLSWDPLLSRQRGHGAVEMSADLPALVPAFAPVLPSIVLIGPAPGNYTRWVPQHFSLRRISSTSDEYMLPVSAAKAPAAADCHLLYLTHEYERPCLEACLKEHAPARNASVLFLYDDLLLNTSWAEVMRDWRRESVGCPCNAQRHVEL